MVITNPDRSEYMMIDEDGSTRPFYNVRSGTEDQRRSDYPKTAHLGGPFFVGPVTLGLLTHAYDHENTGH